MSLEAFRSPGQPTWLSRRLEIFLAPFLALPVAERWFRAMFWTFGFYLVFFSSGFGFREVLPPISFICLCGYWRHNWQGSALNGFVHKWALFVFAVFLLESVIFSNDVLTSLIHVGRGLNKQFLVFFLAMECARTKKDVIYLAWCLLAGCFFQSMVCLWQLQTGFDPIHHDPLKAGRLTGSMGSYWVGNYLILAAIPTACLWYRLARQNGKLVAFFLFLAIACPLVVATVLSGTRAAGLSILVAVALAWAACRPSGHQQDQDACLQDSASSDQPKARLSARLTSLQIRRVSLCLCLVFAAMACLLFVFGEGRLSLGKIFHDSRITLWGFALEVFKTDPWTGVGAWQYRPTVQSLDFASQFSLDYIGQSHPHDAWLQVLCETGVIGFALCFVPIFALVWYALRAFWPAMHYGRHRQFAWAGFCFWLGVMAFFAHWLIGHDFFRPWYQALFLLHLGVACGVATRLMSASKANG